MQLVCSNKHMCAACGRAAQADANGVPLYTIHRDGFGAGPEVPLCEDCGGHELPTCEELWTRIANRAGAGRAG